MLWNSLKSPSNELCTIDSFVSQALLPLSNCFSKKRSLGAFLKRERFLRRRRVAANKWASLAYLHVQKLLLPGVQASSESYIILFTYSESHKNWQFLEDQLTKLDLTFLIFGSMAPNPMFKHVWTPSKTHLVQKDSISNGVVRDT